MAGNRTHKGPLVSLMLLASVVTPAVAQTTTALHGKVLDPTGAPIDRARITALRTGSNSGISTASDSKGEFSLLLEAGRYTVVAMSDGFMETGQAVDVPGTGLESLELILPVAGIHETLTVIEPAGYQAVAA